MSSLVPRDMEKQRLGARNGLTLKNSYDDILVSLTNEGRPQTAVVVTRKLSECPKRSSRCTDDLKAHPSPRGAKYYQHETTARRQFRNIWVRHKNRRD